MIAHKFLHRLHAYPVAPQATVVFDMDRAHVPVAAPDHVVRDVLFALAPGDIRDHWLGGSMRQTCAVDKRVVHFRISWLAHSRITTTHC